MSFVQEFWDIVSKLTFFKIVNEYERGVMFRNGSAIELRKRIGKDEQKRIREEEGVYRQTKRTLLEVIKDVEKPLPKEWHKGIITGKPRHPRRYEKSKELNAGLYFFLPVLYRVETLPTKSVVLDLRNISIPTTDPDPEKSIILASCNIQYKIVDVYKAYAQVHNYENSYKINALSVLTKFTRGKEFEFWKDKDKIEDLEKVVREEMNKMPKDKWGISTEKFVITDTVPHKIVRYFHENIPTDYNIDFVSNKPEV
jgi:regulator of protease activity HflC (stomatin/prohibitin superfamily)